VTLPYASGYHAPVMVRECMDLLQPERGGIFLDGTLGGGGHSEALLERGPEAILYGVDRDPDALAEASKRLERFGDRFRPVRSNFADALETAGIADGTLNGVLLDLGISSPRSTWTRAASPSVRARRWTCGWGRGRRTSPRRRTC
jgi:16S rRNA (cytosine1402-N4)-methyltransferase